jgi:2-C-methyl-D-erythritol 2,4-cyclodiphosphate synthase
MSVRIGSGIDIHAFAPHDHPRTVDGATDASVVLAGVRLPAPAPLVGHSDADVVAHASIDALLGAAGLGDIGMRFGVDDPALAGADSMGLLASVVSELAAAGWRVGNLDVTVVAVTPRLGPHRDAMREALAGALDVALEAVSVKATTTDGLGSIGRAEGVAAWVVCLLERQDAVPAGPVTPDLGH